MSSKSFSALVIALLWVLADGIAEARLPDPAATSAPDSAWLQSANDGPRLVAQRRRRRRGRRKRRRRPPTKPPRTAKPTPQPQPAAPEAAPQGDSGELRRGGRVEFDGRLVQGQTAKAGAIYLFARKRSELRSMVKERTSYRREVLRTVYPNYGQSE